MTTQSIYSYTSVKQTLSVLGCSLLLGLGVIQSAEAIVYTASNEADSNRVIAFDIAKDTGRLTEIGSFPTGGKGTGAPLGNQSAMATDASDRWLFVTNSGDGSLTSFRLLENGLEFVDKINSGGNSPISVTVFGTLVYVLNEGTGNPDDAPEYRYDNISGFRFNTGGLLEAVPNSTRIIDATQLTAPAQVGFNKSGTVLLITEKATNTLTTYVLNQDGTPANDPLKRPSAVPTPFGFEFGDRDFVYITEANGGGPGVTASYRVDRETGTVSSLVDLVDQGNATCWTVLNSDQTLGYSVNTGSDTVSIYKINFNGTLDDFRPNQPISERTGDAPRDAVLTQNNRSLVVLNNGDGSVRAFSVERNGSLTRRNDLPVPNSVTGLVAR
ncbi:MAG: lactonase family protein [Gammaproteobacteria bacterium]|nr:lactonase family protein [Gammaproteobacteria bacterium]